MANPNENSTTRPLAVVTGASTGIGYELARVRKGIASEIPHMRNRKCSDAIRECFFRQQGLPSPLSDVCSLYKPTTPQWLADGLSEVKKARTLSQAPCSNKST